MDSFVLGMIAPAAMAAAPDDVPESAAPGPAAQIADGAYFVLVMVASLAAMLVLALATPLVIGVSAMVGLLDRGAEPGRWRRARPA